MVVIRPLTMPKFSSSTLAIGATQLVVQEALEMISCAAGSYLSSLTPITIVMSSSLAGAEMMTFFAPGQVGRVSLGQDLDRLVADVDGVALDAYVLLERSRHRVVLEEVGHRL